MANHLARHLVRPFALALGLSFLICIHPAVGRAQASMDDIENLFSKEEQDVPLAPVRETRETKPSEIKAVTDLEKLSDFKDVAVIQRRFLPKTGRFEIFGGPAFVLNDKFFLNVGLQGRFAYYFRERYGVELVAIGLTTADRTVTTDLQEKRRVTTTSFVTPKSYLGLDFKWTPIYGKITWRNRHITSFDHYFSIGGGQTGTNQGMNEPTIHIGTGQVFALSKASAVRWDLSWNTYSATSAVSGSKSSANYNNLMITVGMSFFFPEANYR